MNVSEAIKLRRSVRSYQEKEVEKEKLNKVLEAARLAPSASNRQEWKFIVVKDKETKEKLAIAASDQTFIAEAPIILVACATESQSIMLCGQPRYTVDVSIAMSFIILQARELGLGTCWIGAFEEPSVKEILGIPNHIRVVAITPLGYPAQDPPARPRKKLEQIVCFDKYE
ncbi:MAG: nitroreductase family protein [Gammaproteobacteria bacterium]|nr:nitroreductase family protein [Gammaproteobacteria bacterium]